MANFAQNDKMATAQAVPVDGNFPTLESLQQQYHAGPNFQRGLDFLSRKNWPPGLSKSVMDSIQKTAFRIFIVDDSGSMAASDGNRLLETSRGLHAKKVGCTRWAEMVEAVKFHGEFAYMCQAPSEFRLLNSGHPVQIGAGEDNGQSLGVLNGLLSDSPGGGTPLCYHLNQIVALVQSMEHKLRGQRQEVSLTIFTDGESSDGDMSRALKPLERLPIRVIIRLCTDQNQIVNYWNRIDANLELQMDILDDLFGENEEVVAHNPWLNYAQPLQRAREWGSHFKEFDLLDEGKLSDDQIRAFCALLLGGDVNNYPHPAIDKKGFVRYIKRVLGTVPPVMHPRKRVLKPWIDVGKLSGGGCAIM